MNFRQQLQEAYRAGYRSGLHEQNNPYPPNSIDSRWWTYVQISQQVMDPNSSEYREPGDEGYDEYLSQHDWNGDGKVDFGDTLALMNHWSRGVFDPRDFDTALKFFEMHPSELPVGSLGHFRPELDAFWEGWLGGMEYYVNLYEPEGEEVPNQAQLNFYDYNGDGYISYDDLKIAYDIWQGGGFHVKAIDYIQQLVPDSELPELPDRESLKKRTRLKKRPLQKVKQPKFTTAKKGK
tara:strand:+ start:1110 stop:1817 length:708 start_codon:yes stop_codon:yes gene_type:complete